MNKCFLVSSVTLNQAAGTYVISFSETPTVTNNSCFMFRIPCNILTNVTTGTPITANVSVNGTVTAVPLWKCNGNLLKGGTVLRLRTWYIAQFGNDPNHLIIKEK